MTSERTSDTDMNPSEPQGVGESGQRGAEDVAAEESEPGRYDTGETSSAGRPAGESTMRDATSVDPQEPIDEESPTLPPA
ncbi:MAG: hypothetical protein WKH68_01800 [Candidatus Limnocylindria bacterium]